jgi:type I restriction enzyme, S subunit
MTTATVWERSTVADEFEVQLGKRLDAAVNRGEIKTCINNRGVRWGKVQVNEAILAPLTGADIRDLRLASGDVLMCEGGEIGRSAVWNNEIPEAYFLNTLHRLRSRGRYNPTLLVAFFERWADTGELAALVGKATLAHLTKENLLRIPLPTPTRAEQDRIVRALDAQDALIATLERLIVKQQAIKQGMMQQLVTGRTRLPGFADPWKETAVSDLLEFKNGLNKGSEYFGVGTPIVNFMDVMKGPIIEAGDVLGRVTLTRNEIKRFSARKGDLFFTRTSETVDEVGTAAVLVDDIADTSFSGFILRGRPRSVDVDSRFLARAFQLDAVRAQVASSATYTTRALTNGRSLGKVVFDLPLADEQRAIAGVFDTVDAELSALRARLTKARAIKSGMMQQLLTGRVRLPVEAAS